MGTTSNTETQPSRIFWCLSLFFAALPLGVFILCLELFASASLNATVNSSPIDPIKSAHSSGIYLLKYAVMNFVHCLICLATGMYFLYRFSFSPYRKFHLIVCVAFAIFMLGCMLWLLNPSTTFYAYVTEPALNVLNVHQAPLSEILSASNAAYLKGSILIPTLLGIFVVILASGSFHARTYYNTAKAKDAENKLKDLKSDLIILSLVLASSALTAHLYFDIPSNVLPKIHNTTDPNTFYKDLMKTLSFSSGILFSMTLLATFAPGYFFIVTGGIKPKKMKADSEATGFSANLTVALEGLRKFWKSIGAILAPILAAPVYELLNQMLA